MPIKTCPLSSVWSGPTVAALRSMETEIERLRSHEPELVETYQFDIDRDASRAELSRRTLDDVRAKANALEEKLTAHAARAARNGLVILDYGDTFALPVKRHGEYLLLAAPDSVLGRLTGEQWRGLRICEWVDPTHETIPESWDWIVKTTPADVVEPAPARAPEIPIVAYRERESRAEAGVVLRHEYRVRSCEDVGEDELAQRLGQDWRYYRGDATHVLEERVYRNGEPSTVWTTTSSFDGYERAVEHVDSGVTFVCPVLAQVHADRMADREAARERKAAEERAAYQAQVERAAEAAHKIRSKNAFKRLATSKDRAWAERWNAFTQDATDETRERLRADEIAVRLHDAVIAAETVPAKRRAIKAFLAHVEKQSA